MKNQEYKEVFALTKTNYHGTRTENIEFYSKHDPEARANDRAHSLYILELFKEERAMERGEKYLPYTYGVKRLNYEECLAYGFIKTHPQKTGRTGGKRIR